MNEKIVHQTDAEREWNCDRKSSIDLLDKGLNEAKAKGWTFVDMKNDWKQIHCPSMVLSRRGISFGNNSGVCSQYADSGAGEPPDTPEGKAGLTAVWNETSDLR